MCEIINEKAFSLLWKNKVIVENVRKIKKYFW